MTPSRSDPEQQREYLSIEHYCQQFREGKISADAFRAHLTGRVARRDIESYINLYWPPQKRTMARTREQQLSDAAKEARDTALDEAANLAQQYFTGIFTGWVGKTGDSLITLNEAEDVASECGPICADAIRELKLRR